MEISHLKKNKKEISTFSLPVRQSFLPHSAGAKSPSPPFRTGCVRRICRHLHSSPSCLTPSPSHHIADTCLVPTAFEFVILKLIYLPLLCSVTSLVFEMPRTVRNNETRRATRLPSTSPLPSLTVCRSPNHRLRVEKNNTTNKPTKIGGLAT